MRIATGPLPFTARRLEAPKATPLAAPAGAVLYKHPVLGGAQGLYGFDLSKRKVKRFGGDEAVEILRVVCDFIADQYGGKVRMANKVVWVSLDVMNLIETAKDDEASGLAKGVAAARVAAGVADLASGVPALSGLQKGVLPLYFSADIGERIETGRCDVTVGDLAAYSDDPHAALLKLAELVK